MRVSAPLKVVRGLPLWTGAHDFKFLANVTKASLIKLSSWLLAQVFALAWFQKLLPSGGAQVQSGGTKVVWRF